MVDIVHTSRYWNTSGARTAKLSRCGVVLCRSVLAYEDTCVPLIGGCIKCRFETWLCRKKEHELCGGMNWWTFWLRWKSLTQRWRVQQLKTRFVVRLMPLLNPTPLQGSFLYLWIFESRKDVRVCWSFCKDQPQNLSNIVTWCNLSSYLRAPAYKGPNGSHIHFLATQHVRPGKGKLQLCQKQLHQGPAEPKMPAGR